MQLHDNNNYKCSFRPLPQHEFRVYLKEKPHWWFRIWYKLLLNWKFEDI